MALAVSGSASREDAAPGLAGEPTRQRPVARWVAAGFSIVMIVAVLAPIAENWRAEPRDSFPLSYYPMFSLERGETNRVTYLAGIDGSGNRFPIRHSVVGPGGMNQVRRQINKTVEEGDAARLCRSVAARVARRRDAPYRDIASLQVITARYRIASYFAGDKSPETEWLHAACDVRRAAR